MQATWKTVPGYKGYEVSDQGQVRSYRVRGKANALCEEPIILAPATDPQGYQGVLLRRDGKSEFRRIHQLVLEAFVGPKLEGMVTRHLNGNPRDNRLANLAWGTQVENMADKKLHGTDNYAVGEDRSSILTNAQVIDIKHELLDGARYVDVAEKYGVHRSVINGIALGKSWKAIGPAICITSSDRTSVDQRRLMVDLINAGYRLVDVEAITGFAISAISRIYKKTTGQSIRSYRKAEAA